MAKEPQYRRVEMPEAEPESSRRNLRGYGSGAAKVTTRQEDPRPGTEELIEAVVEKENMIKAYKRVRGNKGAPGVDGMSTEELKVHLQARWARIKEELLEGRYKPQPVRRVEIPKAGGGMRELGIPTVVDRLIQQALHQVLSPVFEPGFSESSYGFRPGRNAHQAVGKAREYVAAGKRWVVDMDLEKFFDRVNHDVLMGRVARRVKDKRILRLIRRYLQSGVMAGGLVSQTVQGTPQGGPLSPLLSNIVLDELDKELERRGHSFCRYADDCNVYVGSRRAGQRVLEGLRRFLGKRLRLQVNEHKSAVDRPWNRQFLGYSLTWGKRPRIRVSRESVTRLKSKLKVAFRQGRGRNTAQFAEQLKPLLRGWMNYFRLSKVKGVFDELDSWIRRKMRCLLWRQWKRPYTRFKRMVKRGLKVPHAWECARNGRGPWWNAGAPHMNLAFSKKFFDQIGLFSLLDQFIVFQRSS